MCSPSAGAMLPYGLKIPSPYFPFGPGGGVAPGHLPTLDFQRSQINDYNVRVQLGLRNYQHSLGLSPFHAYLSDPYAQAYFYKHDPRARFVQEEPKPSHSYIGLIGMAILNSKEKKLVLSDIYQWILDNYPYFRTRGPGWRNSIRHNLSLNDCFIKSGRSANGKGHYWAVHPANVEDFERGDFRRRRAQRKVRRHMGLSVPDDDDSPTPSPTQPWVHHDLASPENGDRTSLDSREEKREIGPMHGALTQGPDASPRMLIAHHHHHHHQHTPAYGLAGLSVKKPSRKRLFDMASLLAPDDDEDFTDAKVGSDKVLENTISTSPEINTDNKVLRREEQSSVGHEEEKYRTPISGHPYENRLSDDEGDNDEDDDNIEEIHVTSDDECLAERSGAHDKRCDSEGRLPAEYDVRYSDKDNAETNSFTIRNTENNSPHKKEETDTQNRHDLLNGLIDKENILQSQIREINSKSHVIDFNINSRDNKNIYERSDAERQGHQEVVSSNGLQRYQSPGPQVGQTHSLHLNHSQEVHERPSPERPSPEPPLNRSDRLAIPLSITVNTSSFSSPITQNSNLPRRPSESSEALSSQTSLLFRGSPYKGDVSKIADAKTVNEAMRRASIEAASAQVSDIMRLQAEGFNWQPFPKDLVRERFSAFNLLEGRSHGLVGHFHQGVMRGIAPFTPQTMLSHSSALSQGITSPLQASSAIPVAAIPSPGSGQHND